MNILIGVFFVSLLFGQLGSWQPMPGVFIYAHDVVLLLVLFFGIRTWLPTARSSRLFVGIAGFTAVASVSLLVNAGRFSPLELGMSALYLARWICYACLYFLIRNDKGRAQTWLWGLCITGVMFASLGLVQYFLYPDLRNLLYLGWDPHYYRLFSTLLDPNFMGILLVLTFLLGMWLYRSYPKNKAILFGLGIVVAALLLTFSRSSYLAFVAAVSSWIVLIKKWRLLALVFLFTGIVFIAPRPGGDTLRILRWESAAARVGNWQEGVQLVLRAPLLGNGFNTLRYARAGEQPTAQDEPAQLSRSAAGLDSSILFVAATTGLVGLAVYGYLYWKMVQLGQMVITSVKTKDMGRIFLLSLAAVFVHSLFTNSMFYPWVMLWMWVLCAVVEQRIQLQKK